MKKFLIIICVLFTSLSLYAQDFKTYSPSAKEDLKDIASKFKVDITTLRKLNPTIQDNSNLAREIIVVPVEPNFKLDPSIQLISYEVSPKETLYSISKSYNLKVNDLRVYNPFLYERELDYNDVIRIPVYALKDKDLDVNQSVKNSKFNTLMHLVLPKETKYGISGKYGLTVSQLEALNPGIDEKEIQPGQLLRIKRPLESQNQLLTRNQDYTFLKIDSKNSIQSISESFDVTEEQLLESNPSLRFEGLSEGLVLKIPKPEDEKLARYRPFNLENNLKYLDTKSIAVMLPFNLERIEIDSVDTKSIIKRSNLLRIALDFYEGIQMAIDTAKTKGINVKLNVYDTRNNPAHVKQQLNSDFRNYHAVIGPLLDPNLKVAAQYLNRFQVPVISPLVNPEFEFDNLYKTLPKEEEMQEMLITYLQKKHTDENLVILTDEKSSKVKSKFAYTFPSLNSVSQKESDYLRRSDLESKLKSSKTNWFILETEDIGLAETTVSLLKSFQRDKYDIRLFTSKRSAFYDDEISNYYLSDLRFTFPSISKSFLLTAEDEGANSYITKKGSYPSRYVIRGYDVMLDVLYRLAYAENLKSSTEIVGFTEYAENKFNYVKKDFSVGYENDAIYLLEYEKGLNIKSIDMVEFLAEDAW